MFVTERLHAWGGFMPRAASFQAMFLQAAVHGAAAEAQRFRGLTHIAVVAGQCALYEVMLDVVEAHVFKARSRAGGGCAQSEIGGANQRAGSEENAALDGVIKFAHIAGPGMLVKELHGHRIETGNGFAIALGVAAQEMVREKVDR